MKHLFIAAINLLLLTSSCGNNENKTPSSTATVEKDEVAKQGETAIDNAGKAKSPKGTITFKIDGESFSANENTVQCMFIGMGSKEMAQGNISGNISGGITISAVLMTKPQIGEIKSKGVATAIGMMITRDGVQYNSNQNGELSINITKITPDGNNYYIGGTFSGTLKSQDGKTITVTDGVFESAYL